MQQIQDSVFYLRQKEINPQLDIMTSFYAV